MHDGRAAREVRAEPHAVRVTDAHTRRHHVVGHAREAVDARDAQLLAAGGELEPHGVDVVDLARAAIGPGDVRQQAEHAVEVEAMGDDETVREQVEPQRRIERVDRSRGEVVEDDGDGDAGRAERCRAARRTHDASEVRVAAGDDVELAAACTGAGQQLGGSLGTCAVEPEHGEPGVEQAAGALVAGREPDAEGGRGHAGSSVVDVSSACRSRVVRAVAHA